LLPRSLLSYPAVGFASYLVGFPLRDTATGLAQTVMTPEGARLPVISGALNAGFLIIVIVAAVVIFVDRRTVFGYELRMRGANVRFAG
jgi:simple sugar transport system permease protein